MAAGGKSVPVLSAEGLAQALERGDELVVLDVREPWEWRQGHLPRAHHMPMNDVPVRRGELDPAQRIVVVCHLGQRSAMVTRYLLDQGFGRVENLDGGMDRWVRLGYAVE